MGHPLGSGPSSSPARGGCRPWRSGRRGVRIRWWRRRITVASSMPPSEDQSSARAGQRPDRAGEGAADVRASDVERERTIELLRDAAAEGRLGFEELADRIDVAAQAVTRRELERLTADLPVPVGAIGGREIVVAT